MDTWFVPQNKIVALRTLDALLMVVNDGYLASVITLFTPGSLARQTIHRRCPLQPTVMAISPGYALQEVNPSFSGLDFPRKRV